MVPDEVVSTDSEGDGATPSDPVETTLTSAAEGTVTITETAVTGTPPTGFVFLGQQIEITAPAGTVSNPIEITFIIDASALPAGGINAVEVFKNGILVADCTGAPQAIPDPCVSSRSTVAGGDGQITILTSTASTWTFGEPTTPAPGTCNGLTATITGTSGRDFIFASPGDVVDAGAGTDFILVRGAGTEPVVICGGSSGDLIIGGDGNDIIIGGGGNDILMGRKGNDSIYGNEGSDLLIGGAGNDYLDGGEDKDQCIGATGTDRAARCEKRFDIP